MARIFQGALSLLAFAAVGGAVEMLLPEGRSKQAAQALAGLIAAKILIETTIGLFQG